MAGDHEEKEEPLAQKGTRGRLEEDAQENRQRRGKLRPLMLSEKSRVKMSSLQKRGLQRGMELRSLPASVDV